MPSSGCVVKRPRRAPVKAMTITQKWAPLSGRGWSYRKITMSVVSCPPRWVNTLKAINQRARLFSAAVMLRPSMFCVFMVAVGLLFCTACCYLRKSCAHGVLGAVEKRPIIHTTCMLCYRKERLSSLYSEMHPTHPAFAPAHVLHCVPVSD